MIGNVIVLGGGSAGFLAAIALKKKLPELPVTVIRSKELGIIGVGESSTVGLVRFLHGYLGIGFRKFFDAVRPTWKLGLRFLWGPRPYFNYTFTNTQLNEMLPGLRKSKGFYCDDEMEFEDPASALMSFDRAFERLPNGNPAIHLCLAYHLDNETFVRFLEGYAAAAGVLVIDGTVERIEQGENGIQGLVLQNGRTERADLYVDCSGFASALLGKALGEPFVDFRSTLACNRAVVGTWDRSDEPIKPYTTCETMTAGWCWQIDHESRIDRGYVYSSSFIDDVGAERELRLANPKIRQPRIVKFVSGRHERSWVKNVVAIGNACGFVEPLEATALGVIGVQASLLADCLLDGDRQPRPWQMTLYNRHVAAFWDNIRGFLAVHYKFNTRIDSPFWAHCQEKTDLAGARDIVEMYHENGPTPLWAPMLIDSANQFGLPGYFALLVGQKVPYRRTHAPGPDERNTWNAARQKFRDRAARGLTVEESLAAIRSPKWHWPEVRAFSTM